MGDENPIRTLGDYFKPSHEVHRNTIKLPDPSPHGRILLPDSLLNSFHREGPQNSAMISRCSNNIMENLYFGWEIRKLRSDEAWAAIERLAQYEDKEWNDALIPDKASLNYENLDINQLLGIMEHKVDTLMKDAILLMGKKRKRITVDNQQNVSTTL
ncbi:hypothetical protein Tco_1528447 [Tanacetum coccineum]